MAKLACLFTYLFGWWAVAGSVCDSVDGFHREIEEFRCVLSADKTVGRPMRVSKIKAETERLSVAWAEKMVDQYFEGRWRQKAGSTAFQQCGVNVDESFALSEAITDQIWTQTVKRLSGITPRLDRFLGLLQDRRQSFTFQILESEAIDREYATDLQAGYVRADRTVFMNLERIDPALWPFIFIHEGVHALDTRMNDAFILFNEVEAQRRISRLVTEFPGDNARLNVEDVNFVDNWIDLGLEKGVVAEIRAWALTYLFYEEVLRNRKVTNSPLKLDEFEVVLKQWPNRARPIQEKSNREDLLAFVGHYLSPRYFIPDRPPFKTPWLRSRIEERMQRSIRDVEFDPALNKIWQED